VVSAWPLSSGGRDEVAEAKMEAIFEIVKDVRNLRAEYRVDPGRWIPATIVAGDDAEFYRRMAPVVGELPGARLRPIEVVQAVNEAPSSTVAVVAGGVTVYIPLAGMIDISQERSRLDRERAEVLAEMERAEALLGRPGFVEKARPDVVAREREKLVGLRDRLAKLDERLDMLGR
jgi:valyl-tRNA synthetase